MTMTSRERVRRALRHEATDRPPIDLGGTPVTGIAASTYHRLRQALKLPERVVRVDEPFQILAEIDADVRQALGIDTVSLPSTATIFGFKNRGWKPWTLEDGTPVLVSEEFQFIKDANGDTLVFARGDRTSEPAGRLPKGGYYFDAIVRQEPLDEDRLDPADWAEQFQPFSEEDLEFLRSTSERLYRNTDCSVVGVFGQGGLGDVAFVPGQMLARPRGLRDPNLWYEFLLTHPDYIKALFEMQTDCALKNLELYRQAVGDRIDVLMMSGTDFGTQRSVICSPALFREMWKPLFTKLNAWVHEHTAWKIFYHSCGAIRDLIPDFIEMGVDILNPVQCSAEGMDPRRLKADFGDKIVFWGGGVDTQRTLPFGTPDEVRKQVRERIDILGRGGGLVFNTIHNIQAKTPVENVLAMYEEARRVV